MRWCSRLLKVAEDDGPPRRLVGKALYVQEPLPEPPGLSPEAWTQPVGRCQPSPGLKPGRSRGARRAGRGRRPGSCALPPSTAGLAFPECTWRVRPRVGVTVVPEGQDIRTRCDQRHSGERTAGLRAACGHQTPAALDSGWALSLQEECEELGATRPGGACVRSPPPCCCHGLAQPPGAQPGPRGLHSARCGWGEPGPGAPASAVPSCGRPRLGRRPDLGLKKALLASAMACPVQGTKGSPLKLNLF